MKIKMFTPFFVAIMLLSTSSMQAQSCISEKQAINMLETFYKSYITESSRMPSNVKQINALKRKYCTKRFLNKIETQELDYDPLLKAQDSNLEWLKSLTVNKAPQKGNLYYVSYIDAYNNTKTTIKINVVKEKEEYKIDSIL